MQHPPHGRPSRLPAPLLVPFLALFRGLFGCGEEARDLDPLHACSAVTMSAGADAGAPAPVDPLCVPGPSPPPPESFPCYGGCEDGRAVRARALPRPYCPAEAPSVGAGCFPSGLRCSYGDSAQGRCRSEFLCTAGRWTATRPFAALGCPAREDCPAEPPHEQACRVPAAETPPECGYPDGLRCYCGSGLAPESTSTWACYGPPKDTRCPALLPNIGEGCADDGVECTYSALPCEGPGSVVCRDGQWQHGQGPPCDL